MRILCLQHSDCEGPGCVETWAKQRGHSFDTVMLHRGENVRDADRPDWLVVLGGPMRVHDESSYPWLAEEKDRIRRSIDQGCTIVGICLGAQLVAHVLEAPVTRNRHAELGWMRIATTPEARVRFPLWPRAFYALCWHNDTFGIPASGIAMGSSEACENQGFYVGDRIVGLQFHLEWTMRDISLIVNACPEDFLASGKYAQRPEDVLGGVAWAQRANLLMADMLDALPA